MARVLITGSRNWTDREVIAKEIAKFIDGTVFCHGAARGADTIAGEIATALGYEVHEYPARWSEYGKRAGPIRNQHMLDDFRPDVVLAFPLPDSIGTFDMMRRAKRAGVEVLTPTQNEEVDTEKNT